jgi:hypothetical protein
VTQNRTATFLREKAEHCRDLATIAISDVVREALIKCAAEFDVEADRLEAEGLAEGAIDPC